MDKMGRWAAALAVSAAGAAAFLARRRLFRRWLSLPPVQNGVRVQRGVTLTLPNGLHLAADIYLPQNGKERFPTILIRTPYGRRSFPAFFGQRFAERGYAVVAQDVRGRFGSQGQFEPRIHEAADGLETITWITRQPWSNGRVGTWGQSYLGMVQWAVAIHNPPPLQAVFPAVTMSRGVNLFYPYGIFALEFVLRWLVQVDAMDALPGTRPVSRLRRQLMQIPNTQDSVMPDVWQQLPLAGLDEALVGRTIPFYQQYLQHGPDDPFWQPVNYQAKLENVTAPVHLMSGWYDFMLGDLLSDYERLVELGHRPYLTIGPWHHFDLSSMVFMLREGLAWMDAHLRDDPGALRQKPVRLLLMGADKWLELEQWPPPARVETWYLQANGRFSPQPPAAAVPPSTYLYNPANPTPNVGGAAYTPKAGAQDQAVLEARADVLTFTSSVLEENLDVVGPVRVGLYVHTTAPTTDFVARLCAVDENGRSHNICDGIVRLLKPEAQALPDGTYQVEIDLWATAYRFRRGQRLRVQICSAAHPRWARNPGTIGPLATNSELQSARQTVFHDAERPSFLHLPILIS